jgi:hypothetical protein
MHEQQNKGYLTGEFFTTLTTKKAIIIIACVGILIFFNSLFSDFVWDDLNIILPNADIHTFSLAKIFGPSFFNGAMVYRPMTALYFSVLYSLFNNTTFFYHLLQLTLHIVNTSLVFVLFSKLFDKKISFFLSLIFLVHPIQVESVSYISASDMPLFFIWNLSIYP